MGHIKCYNDFINETFLDTPINPDYIDRNKKKMKKNGFIEAVIKTPVKGLEVDDVVLVSSTEFSELEGDSLVICYKGDDEIIIPKKNLEIKV